MTVYQLIYFCCALQITDSYSCYAYLSYENIAIYNDACIIRFQIYEFLNRALLFSSLQESWSNDECTPYTCLGRWYKTDSPAGTEGPRSSYFWRKTNHYFIIKLAIFFTLKMWSLLFGHDLQVYSNNIIKGVSKLCQNVSNFPGKTCVN